TRVRDGDIDGLGDIELFVRGDAGHDERHSDVEDGADDERGDDADGQVALRIFALLRRRRDGIEADIGKEDGAGAGEDTAPAVLAEVTGVLGDEWVPVVDVHVRGAAADDR